MAHTKSPSVDRRVQKERRRSGTQTSSKSLCALFDFRTLSLDSVYLSERGIARQTSKFPDRAVSRMAVQNYINGSDTRPTTKITTIIVISRGVMSKLVTARIPCCNGKEALYLQKVRDRDTGEFYIEVLERPPKYANKLKVTKRKPGKVDLTHDHRFRWPALGMTVAVVYSVFAAPRKPIINELLYHAHGAPVNDLCLRDQGAADQTLGSPTNRKCKMPLAMDCESLYTADPRYAMKRHKFINKDTFSTMKELKRRKSSSIQTGRTMRNGVSAQKEGTRTMSRDSISRDTRRRNTTHSNVVAQEGISREQRMGRKTRRERKWTGQPLHIDCRGAHDLASAVTERGDRAVVAVAEGTKRRKSRPRRVQQRVCGDGLDEEPRSRPVLDLCHSRSVSISSASAFSSISSSSSCESPSVVFAASLSAPLTPLIDMTEP